MKLIKIIFVFLLSGYGAFAQQDAQFTQYMYNTININPAYAGSRDVLSVFGLHRTQWVGLDGAPVSNTFSINTPIDGTNIGLGLGIINDKIGPAVENNIAADFSYFINTSEKYKLSFGLKASVNLLDIDFTKLTQDPSDPKLKNNVENLFSPNIGAGVYFHSDNAYIGLSVPNIIETKHFDTSDGTLSSSYIAKERMNLYAIAGHVFEFSDNFKLKPAVLSKIVAGAPLQLDFSANALINEKFTLGFAYRWSAAFSAMAGFQVNPSWFIGYAYDREITKLVNFNSGSHEIFLRYELFQSYTKVITPRFF